MLIAGLTPEELKAKVNAAIESFYDGLREAFSLPRPECLAYLNELENAWRGTKGLAGFDIFIEMLQTLSLAVKTNDPRANGFFNLAGATTKRIQSEYRRCFGLPKSYVAKSRKAGNG